MEEQILKDAECAVEGVVLRHDADIAPRERGVRDDIRAGDSHLAGGGQCTRSADADGGRLAGTVWAEQAEDLSLVDGEVDAIDRDDALFALINFGQTGDFDDHLCGEDPSEGWETGSRRLYGPTTSKITANT